jgi:hypothetical protein
MSFADRIRPFTKSLGIFGYVPKRILLGWVIEAEEMEKELERARAKLAALREKS